MKAIIRKERKFIRRASTERCQHGFPTIREDNFLEIETSVYFFGVRIFYKKELSVD